MGVSLDKAVNEVIGKINVDPKGRMSISSCRICLSGEIEKDSSRLGRQKETKLVSVQSECNTLLEQDVASVAPFLHMTGQCISTTLSTGSHCETPSTCWRFTSSNPLSFTYKLILVLILKADPYSI